jgi:hypothetical protein
MVFTPPMPPSKPAVVTIWVHGTKSHESLPTPLARAAKKVAQGVAGSEPGLHHVSELNQEHYEVIRASVLGTTPPILFPQEYMYSFGWSGDLNLQARKKASEELFVHLKQLHYEIVEKTGVAPEFIIIAHSHGGNVVLHLAEIKDPDGFELTITKAILLACPVQKDTSHLVASSLFKRIYSLHSHTDMIQVIDMQGIKRKKRSEKPLFSERHFQTHPKLVQAQIRWKNAPGEYGYDPVMNKGALKHLTNIIKMINFLKKNRGLLHIEFILLPFIRRLPGIIVHLDELFDTGSTCASHRDHDIIIEL